VLLVDDEAHIRKFVGLVLKKFSRPTIVEAGDGLVALELYAREKPDFVLLDVNMPNLDGIQTLERLLQADPEANVVMLTSLANRQTIEDCVRLGALGYIRKDTPKHAGLLRRGSPARPQPAARMISPATDPTPASFPLIAEVRYSLPDLLREVQLERNSPAFATEKLDQLEIAKLFQKNRPRRASRNRKQ
jgi:two-component system chemotaxis response regulator CheY